MTSIPKAFQQRIVSLSIAHIVAQAQPLNGKRKLSKFARQIAASIKEVGVIEPLVVYPQASNRFLLLDGHARLDVLKEMGATEVRCLLANDDEAFTYNRRVSTIPPIAQHLMLLQALKNGLTEERIAAALEVDVRVIQRKRNMLNGICDEAIDLLRDYKLNGKVFGLIRKMKPLRQVEVAEHMIANGSFSFTFVKALLYATKSDSLVERPKNATQVTTDVIANRLSLESDSLLKDLKNLEDSFGKDALLLTVCGGFVGRLLSNPRVLRYLEKKHGESLNALQLWLENKQLSA
jgi:hypothetical protein